MGSIRKGFTILIIFLAIGVAIHLLVSSNNNSLIGYTISDGDTSLLEEKDFIAPLENVKEFHFDHVPITYALDVDTTYYNLSGIKKANDEGEKERINWALQIIEKSIDNLIQFKEVGVYENPDIIIYGLPPEENENEKRFITEGFAGPTEVSDNKILNAEVILYASKSEGYRGQTNTFEKDGWLWERTEYNEIETISWEANECKEFPQTEIHEILHALGFGHIYNNSYSIMAPVKHRIQSCKVKKIDKEIVSCLKYIYSNGKVGEECSNLSMYPWDEESKDITDFKWNNLPISYSTFDCNDRQKWNLQIAEKVIEKYVKDDLYEFKENEKSQINFYCHNSFDDVLLNEETDFWDATVYFPSAQPYFHFKDDKIKEVEILLFAQDRACGGIEVHELLHGIGLREHYGHWMKYETELCDINTLVIGKEAIDKIKDIYSLN